MEVETVQRANCVMVSIATEADVEPASQADDANIFRVERVVLYGSQWDLQYNQGFGGRC